MASGQTATHHPPGRGRARLAQGYRQRLPDAHQPDFTYRNGEPTLTSCTFYSRAEAAWTSLTLKGAFGHKSLAREKCDTRLPRRLLQFDVKRGEGRSLAD